MCANLQTQENCAPFLSALFCARDFRTRNFASQKNCYDFLCARFSENVSAWFANVHDVIFFQARPTPASVSAFSR